MNFILITLGLTLILIGGRLGVVVFESYIGEGRGSFIQFIVAYCRDFAGFKTILATIVVVFCGIALIIAGLRYSPLSE